MSAPVLVMAGGTGGHIFPGLAVADELRARGVPVVWLGGSSGLETTLVPKAGLPLEQVTMAGVRGKRIRTLMAAPWQLARAVLQALAIIKRHRPRAAIAFGGYASAPGGVAARLFGVPLLVHEQNRVPGLTNRLLARLARRVLCGFPGTFRHDAGAVGNPVRAPIAALPPPSERLAGRSGALRVLVLGGSQGARALNRALPVALARLPAGGFDVRHQAGRAGIDDARAAYAQAGVVAQIDAFVDDMAAAYAWADVVVCRAGALTLAELCAAGVGAVLVPFPHAVDDHQTRNAEYLVERGAAILRPEGPQLAEALATTLADLAADRGVVLGMAEAARRIAAPDAARRIADACLEEARP
ncbi:MAG: undecaprenyldiphospho-muramoylpentapeptide beta-N-acetylglucosaminyltransferase [Xanthomonadaceae bacterium]|jgi:UDP-N-acetylglucosamine--N-acetylmuramyl-(pentapeptide) pyrophosphoryl-undecaprenol N-acetylglucosamine transferase|nr:undecaprenyldiphospho-muramoylpentapeptide beta-N-acetylglucosaminyltransferase [Xanthomonadaceae bacterium]